jgi:hypothetical protein
LKNYNFNEPGEGINHSIIHVPHASNFIPDACKEQFIISEKELNLEILKLTDHFTDSLVEGLQAVKVVFPYSRLLFYTSMSGTKGKAKKSQRIPET